MTIKSKTSRSELEFGIKNRQILTFDEIMGFVNTNNV